MPDEIKLPAQVVPLEPPKPITLQRQQIRRLGFLEILLKLKKMYPLVKRPELRKFAHQLHKLAWDGRDREAIQKLKQGVIPKAS